MIFYTLEPKHVLFYVPQNNLSGFSGGLLCPQDLLIIMIGIWNNRVKGDLAGCRKVCSVFDIFQKWQTSSPGGGGGKERASLFLSRNSTRKACRIDSKLLQLSKD